MKFVNGLEVNEANVFALTCPPMILTINENAPITVKQGFAVLVAFCYKHLFIQKAL